MPNEALIHPDELQPLIDEIIQRTRTRQGYVRAQNKLILQMQSICRRLCGGSKTEGAKLYAACRKYHGGKNKNGKPVEDGVITTTGYLLPFLKAEEPLKESRAAEEKSMIALAKGLPVYDWWISQHGLGDLGLPLIVGSAGNPCTYPTVQRLWKRMGLAVIDGRAQRKVKDAEEALIHGFSPSRRAIMYTIGVAIVQVAKGPYREIYDARRAYEEAKGNEWVHKRAMRYATKMVLKHLWVKWREVERAAGVKRAWEGRPLTKIEEQSGDTPSPREPIDAPVAQVEAPEQVAL